MLTKLSINRVINLLRSFDLIWYTSVGILDLACSIEIVVCSYTKAELGNATTHQSD